MERGQNILPSIRITINWAAAKRERLLEMVTVAVTVLVLTLVASAFVDTFGDIYTPDATAYYDESFDPFNKANNPPYSYRLLTPLLAGLMPVSNLLGFAIVNASGFAVLFHLVYLYLRKLQFPVNASIAGVIVIASSPTLIYTFSNTCLVDSLSYVLLLVACIAVLERNDGLFVLAITLGVLNKETVLLAVPLYLLQAAGRGRMLAAFAKTAAVSLPAVLLFVAVRLYFGLGEYYTLSTIDFVLDFHANEVLVRIVYLLYVPFGALWLLMAWSVKDETCRFLKRSVLLLPLVFVQLLVATDIDRMLFIGFPVILPLAIGVAVRGTNATRQRRVKIVLSLLLILTLAGIPFYHLLEGSFETGTHNIYFDLCALAFQSAVLLILVFRSHSIVPKRALQPTPASS